MYIYILQRRKRKDLNLYNLIFFFMVNYITFKPYVLTLVRIFEGILFSIRLKVGIL